MSPPDRRSERLLAALVLAFTLASALVITPYHFGDGDNSITIPFLRASIDHRLYPGDYLLAQRVYYYTYLWEALGSLYAWIGEGLSKIFFACYLIAIAATFLAVYRLARTLFGSRAIGWIAMVFLLFPRGTFGGVSTIEDSLNTRAVATPLLLFAFDAFLRRRPLWCGALLGLAYLIHPLTANYMVLMLAVAAVFAPDRSGAKAKLQGAALFLLIACPILIWKLRETPPSLHLFSADPRWVAALRLRSPHHMFPSEWGWQSALHALLLSVLFPVTWLEARRPGDRRHRIVLVAAAVIAVLGLLGAIFTEARPLGIAFLLQPFRAAQFLEYLVMLYAASFVYERLLRGGWKNAIAAAGVGAVTLVGVDVQTVAWLCLLAVLAVLYARRSWAGSPRLELRFAGATAAVVALGAIGYGAALRHHVVITYHNVQDPTWLDVQEWARESTDLDAGFIVPPNAEEFRVNGGRSVYADWEDGGLMNSNPAFGLEWTRRIRMLGDDEDGECERYARLPAPRIEEIAREMRAAGSRRVFVVEPAEGGGRPPGFPMRYANRDYRVFEVPLAS
jgi:hypothetical protein